MSKSKQSARPATGPKLAEAQCRALIAKFATKHARLVSAVRRSLRKRLPAAVEMVYEYRAWIVISYSPSGEGYEGILGVRADADGVKLYFNNGKELPDPEKLLRGSGGLVRYIDVESAPTLARPAVVRLIDEAIARNRVPFANAAGSIVIRSSAAKKPRRKRPA